MKATRIIAALCAIAAVAPVQAENLIQVRPQRVCAGSTNDDARSFAVEMKTDESVTALQFDMYLPDGLELDPDGWYYLSTDRCPYIVKRGQTIFDHELKWYQHDGFVRVMVFSQANSYFTGSSGVLFEIEYISDEALPEGILPVRIENVTLALNGTSGLKPDPASCYLYNSDEDPALTETSLDLSGLTAAIPDDIVGDINASLAANPGITEILAYSAPSIGAPFEASNPNCLTFVKAATQAEETMRASAEEVFNLVVVGENESVCDALHLSCDHPYGTSRTFTATQALFERHDAVAGWNSICIPFTASVPKDVKVEHFDSYDEENATFRFMLGNDIPAHVPCLFKTEETSLFLSAENVEVNPEVRPSSGEGFFGTYVPLEVAPDSCMWESDAIKGQANKLAEGHVVNPFHAYFVSPTEAVKIFHESEDSSGVIESAMEAGFSVEQWSDGLKVLSSRDMTLPVYTPDGTVAGCFTLKAGVPELISLPGGIYIVKGEKILVP